MPADRELRSAPGVARLVPIRRGIPSGGRSSKALIHSRGMFVGIVRIELHLPGSRSLKDKRSVVQGLKERIRHRVRASVAEVEHQDLWQRAALGVAVVSGERRQVDEMLQTVRHLVQATHGAELLDWQEQEGT